MIEAMDSIFTKIIRGDIPAHYVYKDDLAVGFLDIHPIQPGHTLIVPKAQVEQFTDMDEPGFSALMRVAHQFSKHMKEVLGCKRVVVRIEGFDIPHTHVHLIPVNEEHESYRAGRFDEEPDHEALAAMAKKLAL